jgi:hypothetical protein
MLASGLLVYAGCVSLTLPPNGVDGAGAGGARVDPDGQDFPGSGGGTGAALGSGTGGSATPGTDAAAVVDADDDSRGGPGGVAGRKDVASTGGVGGQGAPDSSQEVADAPPDDGPPDIAVEPPSDGPADVPEAPPADGPPDAPVVAPTAGLVVYYACELADGSNLQDLSGKGNSGQIVAMSADGFRFDSGKIGKGLTLSQVGDSGYVGFSASAIKGASALTVATWIRLNTLTTWQRIFEVGVNANLSQNTATGTAYLAFFLKDANNQFGLTSTKDGFGSAIQVATDSFEPGAWRHVAFVVGPAGATLYLDGAAVGTVASMLAPKGIGAIDYAFIGRSQFSADPFLDAEIDEFRVYNRVLSADEIQTLFDYTGS